MPPSPSCCPIPNSGGDTGPTGPIDADICFIGEASGAMEAVKGIPFVGPAGGQLDRILSMIGWDRSKIRIGNVKRCHPPNDWLVGAPWENSPCSACDDGLQALLAEPHKVFITLGGTALRKVLGLKRERGKEPVKLDNFHGAPTQDIQGRWIVATYHPSFLMQGGQRFIRTVCFDMAKGAEVAKPGWEPTRREMISDPVPAWFAAWVEETIARAEAGQDVWLSIDFETLEKEKETDEGELQREGGRILWANFSTDPKVGITVVWSEHYRPAAIRLLTHPKITKIFHNGPFDVAAAEQDGIAVAEPIFDFMDAWHVLHPTLKRGLGFVTPFYSNVGPWKHLGIADPKYRCLDASETLGNAFGIADDLVSQGMWGIYYRHCYLLDKLALRPATRIGLPFRRDRLEIFRGELEVAEGRLIGEIGELVPESIRRLDGPYVTQVDGWNVEREEELLVQCCSGCGAQEVSKSHRCADRSFVPAVSLAPRTVTRYYRREPFNPGSWQQVLAYIKSAGHKPGKAKKTRKDTTDKKTLNRLVKTGDPFYPKVLEHRQVSKMKGTYCDGILERMDEGGRVHGEFGHLPYSMRLNGRNPNLQNLSSHVNYADGFRRTIEAAEGCRLVSLDYAGSEAVDVGWWSGDPDYIRLAKLGVHAYVAAHKLKEDGLISELPSLSWAEADLIRYLADIKARFPAIYEAAKRGVHGRNYGQTDYGLSDFYPELFPTPKAANRITSMYEAVCPKLKPYQAALRQFTHEKKFIGGPAPEGTDYWGLTAGIRDPRDATSRIYHPHGYRCEFYGVLQYQKQGGKWKEYLGPDAKKVVAWPSQSTTAGKIAEAALALYDPERAEDYIGDLWYGRTPLRAIIHDELLNEVPMGRVDELLEKAVRVMSRDILEMPMPLEWGLGPFLRTGVSAKVGRNWAPWHPVNNPDGMKKVGVETLMADVWREEEEEEEEVMA